MDLPMGEDLYESFIHYQRRVIEELDALAEEYQFNTIDATRSIDDISEELCAARLPPAAGRAAVGPSAGGALILASTAAAASRHESDREGLLERLAGAARRVRRRADADAVHDLRVAARQFEAALDLWRGTLRRRPARRARRALRELRRSLGPAREARASLALLNERAPHLSPEGRGVALQVMAGAQGRIERLDERAARLCGRGNTARLLRRIEQAWPGSMAAPRASATWLERAGARIGVRRARAEAALREAQAAPTDDAPPLGPGGGQALALLGRAPRGGEAGGTGSGTRSAQGHPGRPGADPGPARAAGARRPHDRAARALGPARGPPRAARGAGTPRGRTCRAHGRVPERSSIRRSRSRSGPAVPARARRALTRSSVTRAPCAYARCPARGPAARVAGSSSWPLPASPSRRAGACGPRPARPSSA